MATRIPQGIVCLCLFLSLQMVAFANRLGFAEQIETATFGKLREVERHQLKIAEKLYLKGEFAVAIDEYDKFLQLYPEGPGAPYAQLMWGHCQHRLRHSNTAIREGFQSVIDYWPESAEAIIASYLIPLTQKEMGEIKPATKGFRGAIEAHPNHRIALLSRVHLLDMAKVAKDQSARVALLEELTFKTKRTTDEARNHCQNASRELASTRCSGGDVSGALQALQTTYKPEQLPFALDDMARDQVSHLHSQKETSSKDQAKRLADLVMRELEAALPDNPGEDKNRGRARDILYRIAGLYGRTGNSDAVLKTYERVGKLTGMDDDLRGRYAGSYRHRNQRDLARQWYAKFDNQIEAKRQIGVMAREDSKWPEAIKIYGELIVEDPNRAKEYQWTIAECYEQSGDQKAAIAAYRLSDNFPESYFRMANCHRRLKQWNEALGLYGQIKAIPSHTARAHLDSAHCLEAAGRKENAIAAFQDVCRKFPKTHQGSRAHAHLQDRYKINITLGGAKDE